jgi:hypothetical protein
MELFIEKESKVAWSSFEEERGKRDSMDMDALHNLTIMYRGAAGNEAYTDSIVSRALYFHALATRPMVQDSETERYDGIAVVELTALQVQQNQRIIELLRQLVAKKQLPANQ